MGRAALILNHTTAWGKRSARPDLHLPWQARWGLCLATWMRVSLHWGLTQPHWAPHSVSTVSPLSVDEDLTMAPRALLSGPLPASPASSPSDFPIPALRPLSAALRPQSWFSQDLLSSLPGTHTLRSFYHLFQPLAPQHRRHLLGEAHPGPY